MIVTASTFSQDAHDYASSVSPRVVLIDGDRLAELMIDHNVGVSTRETYEVSSESTATTSARRVTTPGS